MERIKHTRYFYIIIANGVCLVLSDIETNKAIDKERFDVGNYFADKTKAMLTADKIKQIFADNKNNN